MVLQQEADRGRVTAAERVLSVNIGYKKVSSMSNSDLYCEAEH